MARPRSSTIDVSTPERILAAAVDEFAAQGFGPARLADIARRAGIRRPSLLYHFASKEVLYAAVVRKTFIEMAVALRAARESQGGFEAGLRQMVVAFVEHVDLAPHAARIIVHEILAPDGPGKSLLLEQVAPLLDEIEAWIIANAGERLRDGVPVRAALLQVASSALLRAAAGELREPLWGVAGAEQTWFLTRAAFLTTPLEVKP